MINFPIAIKLLIKRWELSWRFKFAHHPICTNYRTHFWKVGGLYLCQGCSLVYSSFLITLLFLIIFHVILLPAQYLIVGMSLLVSILLIEKYNANLRFIKRLARVGTGLGLGISFSAFLLYPDLFIKLGGLFVSLAGFYLFNYIRRTKEKEDKCQTCADYQGHKICYGLRLEAEAMRKYSEYASDLLQPSLKSAYSKKLKYD